MESPGTTPHLLRFSTFELDVRSGELRQGDRRIHLQEQPFQILQMMLGRPGEIVTRDELRQRLWPDGTFVDFEHGLNAAIKRLRVALGDDAITPRFIETVPRRGYRFIAALDGPAPAAATAASVSALPPQPRLAVLPLTNLSHDPEQEYFSDGLTEELIAQLGTSCRGHVGIIGRWSSMTFKATGQRARAIGEALRADYLLEGSVRCEAERLRITIRLVDAASETQIWSESYDRTVADFRNAATGRLSVQTDVASRVARALALELAPGAADAPLTALPTAVYQSYLKGRYHWNNRGEEGLDAALRHFEHVVDEAPQFGPAYAAISRARTASAEYYRGVPRYELERAHGTAQRALTLAPDLADAHLAMGDVLRLLKWDWAGAEQSYLRALQLNPSAENTRRSYGALLAVFGRRQEARAEAERACELDPLCLLSRLNAAWVSYAQGDYDGTIARCRDMLDMEPDRVAAHRLLGAAYLQAGDSVTAIGAMNTALAAAPDDPVTLAWLTHAQAVAGDVSGAGALLASARASTRYLSPYHLALAYTGLGDLDAAFRSLGEGLLDRDPMLANLVIEPRFNTLRADSRYASIVTQLGLGGAPGDDEALARSTGQSRQPGRAASGWR